MSRISKLLVANRGEIAIRAMRAAFEADITTVAVYTAADRGSIHRTKADEAYEIGDGRPLAGYLDVDGLVATALRVGADGVYPGYGFLSESPLLAGACAAAGLTFVGPPAEVLRLTGDKVRARDAALAAGVPVLPASAPITDEADAVAEAERIGFPVFVKAAAGGGGRGLRIVHRPQEVPAAVEIAMREAAAAFGDATVFLERAVVRPRHIEVQVLADAAGEVVHLYERDCSIQRRHQKVVELAPAPNLDPGIRDRMTDAAVSFARHVGYRNAGTVEFLLGEDGEFVFIEMNPRIQVEHTVTEEVTGIDLVRSQLEIAGGATFAELGIAQDGIATRGAAIQCRITTEDPALDFRPDTGTILAYRSPGGAGIRLDAGSAYLGGEITPYFDSLLVKMTARGADLRQAIRRADRALAEFRVRGVSTNIAFLRGLLAEEALAAGELSTGFIDERPHLTAATSGRDRATRLLAYLADVTVNQPSGPPPAPLSLRPAELLPPLPAGDPPAGSRQRLLELGPDAFAAALRTQEAVAVTETTMRDAHQSLLATRMRTHDMLAVAPHVARLTPQLLSLEMWGGATFDVALRFLHEDPWQRVERLREAVPNICFQMLLRGLNAVGYSTYEPVVVEAFVEEAVEAGVDVFRVFDAFNDVERMAAAIGAVRAAGRLAEGTLCYTGDVADPDPGPYDLDYYLRVAEQLVDAGAHVLCVKDMAGLLKAPAARLLVGALRERFEAPVHLHTHDTGGGQIATYLAAIEAGVDAIDGAAAPLAGGTSQPSLGAIVATTDHTDRATGLDIDAVTSLEPYWRAVRRQYAAVDVGEPAPTTAVHHHQIPGGQLSNLRAQAQAIGVGDRFDEVGALYREVNDLLGDLVKVTPSSKVVGDLTLLLQSTGVTVEELAADPSRYDLPASVIGFLAGDIGTPPNGFPEPFRTRALAGREVPSSRADLSDDDRAALVGPERRETLNRLLLPQPAAAFAEVRERHGDLAVLPTDVFLHGLRHDDEVEVVLERGVRLLLRLDAIGEPDDKGRRTVFARVNGQPRPLEVVDRSIGATVAERRVADPAVEGHVAAPMTGVATVRVDVGDEVAAGDPVAVIEAMKMESSIGSPIAGHVSEVVVGPATAVEPGDLLVVVEA